MVDRAPTAPIAIICSYCGMESCGGCGRIGPGQYEAYPLGHEEWVCDELCTRDARIAELEADLSRARDALSHATETPWVWMNDGSDDLGSMSDVMVVSIQAGQLRAMLEAPKERIAELERERDALRAGMHLVVDDLDRMAKTDSDPERADVWSRAARKAKWVLDRIIPLDNGSSAKEDADAT